MASNFKIICHQHNDNLCIKLVGDFDGSSALELVNILNEHHGKVKKVFIHTDRLGFIHPFGLSVFKNNFTINRLFRMLTFTGKYRSELSLQKGRLH